VWNKFHNTLPSTWPLVAALSAALILVAGINVLWWRLDQQATGQADQVDHTYQIIGTLQETLARADDLVIGQRGFALTRDPDFLKPYFVATNRLPLLVTSLRALLTRDGPNPQPGLEGLESLLLNFEQINREHIAVLVRGNPLEPDLEFRRKIKDSMDAIHSSIGQMVGEQNQLLAQRQESSGRASRIVTRLNLVVCLVSMGLIIAVFSALWRENARRQASELALQRSHEELEERVRQRTLSLTQSEGERKRLEQEILEASDNEMHRIGRDLHDGVGQQLTVLSLFAGSLQKEVETQAPLLAGSCRKIGTELREIIRQVRVLSHGLSPVSIEVNGLVEALSKLADDTRSASKVNCAFEDLSEVPIRDPHLAAQLYRIGQEAVANALKHSGARKIHLSLKATPALTELQVSDDGHGFLPREPNGRSGLGLRAMSHRADVIGATIHIDSAPGQGTRISCKIQKQI
jgi:signal transduction histidine kinase